MATKRVLIVDDDQALAQALKMRCAAVGLAAETSPDGMHALMSMQMRTPDLVILDVNMPADGLSLCERLTRYAPYQDVPVIMLTGRSDVETVHECESLGAAYVWKGGQVWQDLEPLIYERLGVKKTRARPSVTT